MIGFITARFASRIIPYIYDQEATRDGKAKWWSGYFDDYDTYMQAGSAGELGRQHSLEQVGFWRKILAHPSYDASGAIRPWTKSWPPSH